MKKPLPQPCAEWADMLAAVSLAELSPDVQAALKAHLATCAACAAVRADYQRMDARIRAWPAARPLESLPPALVQLWAGEGRRPADGRAISSRSRENGMDRKEEKLVPLPRPNPQPRRPMGRLVSGVSAIAAVVVIAIIVTALVISHGGQPAKTGSAPNGPTTSQNWQVVPHLTNLPGDPVIAPSNPQVVYEAKMASITNVPTTVTIQRSDDGGATWHTLPVPAGVTQVFSATFMVSPLSDQRVFVQFAVPCPTAQSNTFAPAFAPYSGGANTCFSTYFSTDGGAHWSLVNFPLHPGGDKPSFDPSTQYGLQAQGDRLYALIYTPVGEIGYGSSFISSTDGGATWQFVDQSLVAQGECVEGYAVTPTGSTVFATTTDQCFSASGGAAAASSLVVPFSGGGDNNSHLWRSDDAGVDWTLVGPAPDSRLHLSLNSAGQPVLFLPPFTLQRSSVTAVDAQFSLDGGNTWRNAPALNGQWNNTGILGTLSDGSMVVGYSDSKTQKNHLFAWKPGDAAWHQLAGDYQGTPQYLLVVPSGNGHQTLWLVTLVGVDYTVQYLTV